MPNWKASPVDSKKCVCDVLFELLSSLQWRKTVILKFVKEVRWALDWERKTREFRDTRDQRARNRCWKNISSGTLWVSLHPLNTGSLWRWVWSVSAITSQRFLTTPQFTAVIFEYLSLSCFHVTWLMLQHPQSSGESLFEHQPSKPQNLRPSALAVFTPHALSSTSSTDDAAAS